MRARLAWILAAFAAFGAANAAVLPQPLALGAVATTCTLTAGALVASVLPRGLPPTASIALAFALSPFAIGAPWVLLRLIGMDPAFAARALIVVIAVLAMLRAWRPGAPMDRMTWQEWLPGLLWAGLVAALLLGDPWLPPRADGWFHAGVVLQVAERGLPPEDPWFAGLRLLYFWGTHAWAALWLVLAPQLSVWTPLLALNLSAAAATLWAVAALARALGADARVAGWAAVLTVVAWSPFGWIHVAARAAVGEVRGWSEVVRIVESGVDPLCFMLASGQLHASMAFHGDKALVITPFGMGLALFVLGLLAACAAWRETRHAWTLAAVGAAALFVHTVVGYALTLLGIGYAGLLGLAALRRQPGAIPRAVAMLAAAVGPAIALAPYLQMITAGKRGQLALALSREAVGTALLGVGLSVTAAAWWWRRRRAGAEPLLVATLILSALALVLRLPESNQSKFFNLLALATVAPAAITLCGWIDAGGARTRPLRWAALALLLTPTPLLSLWGFASERGHSTMSWRMPSPEAVDVFTWARSHTEPEALFADLGGARELFTISGRSVLWGGSDGERDWGHAPEALDVRRRTVTALCTGAPLPDDGTRLLARLQRPVVVVARQSRAETARALALAEQGLRGYRVLRRGTEVSLLQWEGR